MKTLDVSQLWIMSKKVIQYWQYIILSLFAFVIKIMYRWILLIVSKVFIDDRER